MRQPNLWIFLTSLKINMEHVLMEVWKNSCISKWVISRFHVNLPGCTISSDSSFCSLLNPPRFFKSLEPFCHETLEGPEAWPCTPGTVGNPDLFCLIRQTPRWKMTTCLSNYTCGSIRRFHDGGDESPEVGQSCHLWICGGSVNCEYIQRYMSWLWVPASLFIIYQQHHHSIELDPPSQFGSFS